jgi:hypothetical protein
VEPSQEATPNGPCFRPEYDAATHTYRWRGLTFPGVTTVLRHANLLVMPPCDQATLAFAAERGSLIHAATARVDAGLADGVPEKALAGYVDGYRAFMACHAFTPLPGWTERPMCDPQLQLAGTPDRVGYTNGDLGTVVDLKTPQTHEPGYGVQLAAYRHLLRVNGFKAPRRLLVYLRPNGTFRVRECDDSGDDAAFLAALTLYRWRLRQKGAHAA